MSVPHPNCSVTADKPSLETELMRRRLGTVPTASSIDLVMRFSISSGAALAYLVMTMSCGTAMLGKSSWGKRNQASRPKRATPMKIIEVITGRLTKRDPTFISEFTIYDWSLTDQD